MAAQLIGIVSNLEGQPYREVKKLWALFERKYNSRAIQAYSHPHFTYQIARTSDIKGLKAEFRKLARQLRPFKIEVHGAKRFRKDVIYLSVRKTRELAAIHREIHRFLETRCQDLLELYTPKNWIPHITLAMEDLTKDGFEEAWREFEGSRIAFKQRIHNLCMVKFLPDGKIRIARRHKLGTGAT
jgi:2'-5' RNA ligase